MSKGFGLYTVEAVEKDHFVHISILVDEVREGDEVEFDLQEGNKGLNEVYVKVVQFICYKFNKVPSIYLDGLFIWD